MRNIDDATKQRIESELDFVNLKKYGFSLAQVLDAHPNGCSVSLRARALGMTEEAIEELYDRIILKLRGSMLSDKEIEEINGY